MIAKTKTRYRIGQYAHLKSKGRSLRRIKSGDPRRIAASRRIRDSKKTKAIKRWPDRYKDSPILWDLLSQPKFRPFRIKRLHTVLQVLSASRNPRCAVDAFLLQILNEVRQDKPLKHSGHVFELDALNTLIGSARHMLSAVEIEPVFPVTRDPRERRYKTPDAVLFLTSGAILSLEFKLHAQDFIDRLGRSAPTIRAAGLFVDESVVVAKKMPRRCLHNQITVGPHKVMNLEGAIELIGEKS